MLALHWAYFHRRSDAFGPFRGVIPARRESVDRPRATWAHVYPLIPAVARPKSASTECRIVCHHARRRIISGLIPPERFQRSPGTRLPSAVNCRNGPWAILENGNKRHRGGHFGRRAQVSAPAAYGQHRAHSPAQPDHAFRLIGRGLVCIHRRTPARRGNRGTRRHIDI